MASSKRMIGKSQGTIIIPYKAITKASIMNITKSTKSVAMAMGCHALVVTGAAGADAAAIDGIRRIVFLGDSITQSGDYVTDVECWLIAQGHRLEVLNIGLSSETATPLTTEENAGHLKGYGFPRPCVGDRLDRSLAATKPDLVLVCYGMNDGSSLPEGGEGLRRYAEAITHLRDTALRAGAKRVVLCTPPVHDPLNQIAPDKDPHERNLVTYRDWLLSKRADGWDVVDIHGPMRRDLDAARKTNSAFRFQPDGIHPDRAGHWVMAREILTQFFGADLGGISSSPQFFGKNGVQIRELVNHRRGILFSSLMTQIGHTRPQVVGGPGVPPGPSPETAQAQSSEIAKSIEALIQQ
jgi:lysophospholipase L1-like esterase